MARGRMISKAICLDEKMNALSNDTARLLFTWIIPNLDCEGRLHGDAQTVKSIVFPRRNISTDRIEKYLTEFEKSGLILRYALNGNTYLFLPQFTKHQTGLQKEREAQSQIPPPAPELLQSESRVNPDKVYQKIKLKSKYKIKYIHIIPDWIDKDIWEGFLDMRKKKKAIPTEKAKELLINELEKLRSEGHNPNEVLNQSIMRNYTGVFPLKGGQGGAHREDTRQSHTERLKASVRKKS